MRESFPRGYADVPMVEFTLVDTQQWHRDFYECQTCYALVADPINHEAWHGESS